MVHYKMGDKFRFLVGGGLTLKNLIFDGIDSVIDPTLDTNSCLTQSALCCYFDGTKFSGADSCVLPKVPDEECVANLGMSFIEFDIHSQTGLLTGTPPTLTIQVRFYKLMKLGL